MSSTLAFRVALSDSTNSNSESDRNRKLPKTKHSRFPFSGSRKSPPTLIVSLANVNASCIHTNKGIASPPSSLDLPHQSEHINIIPFPSSYIPFPTSSESVNESDSPALLCINSNDSHAVPSIRPYQVRPRASPAETRRRRSNAWLSQKVVHHTALTKPAAPKKRTRRTSKRLNDDLRFLSVMRRSVEWNLAERDGCVLEPKSDRAEGVRSSSKMRVSLEAQDGLLVRRLGSYLLGQGYQDDDLPTSLRTPTTELNYVDMDADMEQHTSTLSDVVHQSPSAPLSSRSMVPSVLSPPPTPPGLSNRLRTLSMSQLVAALMLRRQDRSTLRGRSATRPQHAAGTGNYYHTRRSSPLALCEL